MGVADLSATPTAYAGTTDVGNALDFYKRGCKGLYAHLSLICTRTDSGRGSHAAVTAQARIRRDSWDATRRNTRDHLHGVAKDSAGPPMLWQCAVIKGKSYGASHLSTPQPPSNQIDHFRFMQSARQAARNNPSISNAVKFRKTHRVACSGLQPTKVTVERTKYGASRPIVAKDG